MKRLSLFLMAAAAVVAACNVVPGPVDPESPEVPSVDEPITLTSPQPALYINSVSLNEAQKGYVDAGNQFAFNCLGKLFAAESGSMVFSPLSLQYALAMTVNGASGETAAEITKALGYGTDLNALNEYCNLLLKQLPAVDKDVNLNLSDIMMVQDKFPLLDSFRSTLNDTFYAPVEYFSFANKKYVADRINEWAYRNTNGLIYPLVKESDISDQLVAVIMNALYFKAAWAKLGLEPLFTEEGTLKKQTFYLDGGGKAEVDLMRNSGYLSYVERDDYQIVSLPYASGKYCMYVLLPKVSGKDGLTKLVAKLPSENWKEVTSSMTTETLVHLRMPKFTTDSDFELTQMLRALGIKRAFTSAAQFDQMFDKPNSSFLISNIIQKAKISVAEWGTEAAAVTVVMVASSAGPPSEKPKEVNFFADHPFVYVIAEQTSGAILFEGTFDGK